tara:strand:- start:2 stop:241 length:240 start_codon:yes stop_codon:yes gene_type:complete
MSLPSREHRKQRHGGRLAGTKRREETRRDETRREAEQLKRGALIFAAQWWESIRCVFVDGVRRKNHCFDFGRVKKLGLI